jgi:hypothetical protein
MTDSRKSSKSTIPKVGISSISDSRKSSITSQRSSIGNKVKRPNEKRITRLSSAPTNKSVLMRSSTLQKDDKNKKSISPDNISNQG